jgi:hypothetical protein
MLRGLKVPCGYRYNFTPTAAYDQREPTPTDAPTFNPTDWPIGDVGYFNFTFSDNDGMSISQTVVFESIRPQPNIYMPIWTGNITLPPSFISGSFLLYDNLDGTARLAVFFPDILVDDYEFTSFDPFTTEMNGFYARISTSAPPPGPGQIWQEINELTTGFLPAPTAPNDQLDLPDPEVDNLGNTLYPVGIIPWPGPQTISDYGGEDGYWASIIRPRGQTITLTEIGWLR